MVGVVAASSGAVGAISALSVDAPILLGYIGGFLSGGAISVLLWLGFFALWKAVTIKIADMEEDRIRNMTHAPFDTDAPVHTLYDGDLEDLAETASEIPDNKPSQ